MIQNRRDARDEPANWTRAARFEPGKNASFVERVLARKCDYDQLVGVFCIQLE